MNGLEVPIDTGEGPQVVLLHGYAMCPGTYGRLADLLARRCRVVIPDLFAVGGAWSYPRVLDAFTATLDRMGLDQVTLLGHCLRRRHRAWLRVPIPWTSR